MNIRKLTIIFGHALVGWALWVAAMLIYGQGTVSCYGWCFIFSTTLLPLVFVGLSLVYFKQFNYTPPLLTATLFTGLTIAGFLILALLLRSLDEFAGIFEWMWISFPLIFGATYLTGVLTAKDADSKAYRTLKSIPRWFVAFFEARNPGSIARKIAVVIISAIISAFASGVFGFLIVAFGWGLWEGATIGIILGFPAGLVVGIGWSIRLMVKGDASGKAIVNTLLAALLISGVFVLVAFSLVGWLT